jgi:predicted amidohydrolase YtcJ
VLSADIEATDPENLHAVQVAATVCGGKVTYQA